MSDTPAAPAPVEPAKEFEALILIAHRITSTVEHSTVMADAGLSLPAFAVLVAMAEDPGSSGSKLAKKASVAAGPELREARKSLVAAGYIESKPTEDGKQAFSVTPKGTEALAAVRARFAEIATATPDTSWKTVPRLARMVRKLSPGLPAAPVEAAPAPAATAKGGGKGGGKGGKGKAAKAA